MSVFRFDFPVHDFCKICLVLNLWIANLRVDFQKAKTVQKKADFAGNKFIIKGDKPEIDFDGATLDEASERFLYGVWSLTGR